jgi:hypothetical protein
MTTHTEIDTATIARTIDVLRTERASLQAQIQDMEAELLQRIRNSGGTELPDPDFRIALDTGSPRYDHGIMVALLECGIPDAEIDKAYAPEHEETRTVPAKWNGTQVKVLERKYGDAARIIGQARIPGDARLVVERTS